MTEITIRCGEDQDVQAKSHGNWSKSNQNIMIVGENGNRATLRGVFAGACMVACGREEFHVTILEHDAAIPVSEVAQNEAAKIEMFWYEQGLNVPVVPEDLSITQEEQEVFGEMVDEAKTEFESKINENTDETTNENQETSADVAKTEAGEPLTETVDASNVDAESVDTTAETETLTSTLTNETTSHEQEPVQVTEGD